MRSHRTATLILFAILAGGCWRACGPIVSPLDDFSGIVVDARAERPVAGASVIAVWFAEPAFAIHPSSGRVTHLAETISDASGRFRIDAPFTVRPPWRVYRGSDWAFQLYAFKPGYMYRTRWRDEAIVVRIDPGEEAGVFVNALAHPRDVWSLSPAEFPAYHAHVQRTLAQQPAALQAEVARLRR